MELQHPRWRNIHSTKQPATQHGGHGKLRAKSWRSPTGDATRLIVSELVLIGSIASLGLAVDRGIRVQMPRGLTFMILLASFLPSPARRSNHNRRIQGSSCGPTQVNELHSTHPFRDNSTLRRRSPLPEPRKLSRTLDSNSLNPLTMICFLPVLSSPIGLTILGMAGRASVAS